MNRIIIMAFILVAGSMNTVNGQRNIRFDEDWRFYLGNDTLASSSVYNDASWRQIELPHDWTIENIAGTDSPFDSSAIAGVHTGFTVGGVGWYRKNFLLPSSSRGKKIIIRFDGVYMNADFYINGIHLGNHPYGYTSFEYDLTEHIDWDKKNTLAVRVSNEGRNSRWYSGSGIYRHVWLNILNPVHILPLETHVTTPRIKTAEASIHLETAVYNESVTTASLKFFTTLLDPSGKIKTTKTSSKRIKSDQKIVVKHDYKIPLPELWSVESPSLYTAVTKIYRNNILVDSFVIPFGIRTINFDAVNGFRLNGKSIKLKGGCVHHDNGPLGSKAYDRSEERKVALLKASGYNAIRTSHNPPSPAFMDACDRLGMLVIEEAFDTWNEKKNKNDYNLYFKDWWQKDIQSMIYRDRNHPSVIMWSSGNEIPNRGKDEVAELAKTLTAFIKSLDTTRPVTAGVNGIDQNPDAFTNAVDIPGYNYAVDSYEADHQRFPQRVMYGSESFPLDAFKYWMGVKDHPYVIGDFVWTAFDYIGEASIGWLGYPQSKNFYPWNLAYCGDIDICGWKRPQSYYREALWKKDQLSIFVKPPVPTFKEWNEKLESWSRWNWQDVTPDWNWKGYEDSLLEIEVYSSCDSAALYLNDKLIGRKATGRNEKYMALFKVPYSPGVLNAKGFSAGKKVAEASLETAGEPSAIKLTADKTLLKAGEQDLSYITVEIVDSRGRKNPKAASWINFTIEGPATIAGIANANPKFTGSFQSGKITTWQGKCLLVVKAGNQTGDISIQATSPGLAPGRITLRSSL